MILTGGDRAVPQRRSRLETALSVIDLPAPLEPSRADHLLRVPGERPRNTWTVWFVGPLRWRSRGWRPVIPLLSLSELDPVRSSAASPSWRRRPAVDAADRDIELPVIVIGVPDDSPVSEVLDGVERGLEVGAVQLLAVSSTQPTRDRASSSGSPGGRASTGTRTHRPDLLNIGELALGVSRSSDRASRP